MDGRRWTPIGPTCSCQVALRADPSRAHTVTRLISEPGLAHLTGVGDAAGWQSARRCREYAEALPLFLDHPRDRLLRRGALRHRPGRALEVFPRERAPDAPRPDRQRASRRIDGDDHEALEERRDVVVEHRRQPLRRRRPGAQLPRPDPGRPLPPRRRRGDLRDDVTPVRIVGPLRRRGLGRPRQRRPEAQIRAAAAIHEVVHGLCAGRGRHGPRGSTRDRACPLP